MNDSNALIAGGQNEACQSARRLLEWARPGENAEGLAEARQHAAACEPCRAYLQRQQRFDARVGAVMRDVRVPPGLQDRLQLALERQAATPAREPSTGTVSVAPAMCAPPARRAANKSRRRLLGWITTACCLAALGLGVWSMWPLPPAVEFDRLMHLLTAQAFDAAALPAAHGGGAPLPRTMSTRYLVNGTHRVTFDQVQCELALFEVPRGGQTLTALLAIVPASQVQNAPVAARFLAAGPSYWGGYCTTAWREGDSLFVVCVRGNAADLRRLLPRDAATA
jgi:hypothetical protein